MFIVTEYCQNMKIFYDFNVDCYYNIILYILEICCLTLLWLFYIKKVLLIVIILYLNKHAVRNNYFFLNSYQLVWQNSCPLAKLTFC